ncbi:MAG: patatin-like phospholipase family protein [Sandaracinaceae bacterium]|nr:patatin-like phospholipase family protein [Sandaracinaceae bacterium]
MDTILYFGARFDDLGLQRLADARVAEDGSIHYAATERAVTTRRRVLGIAEPERALGYLRHQAVDALLLDARGEGLAASTAFLDQVFPHGRMGGPILRQRVLAIVEPDGVEGAFALGHHGIGGVVAAEGGESVEAALSELLSPRGRGKIAICLAGGGIEGLLYELGVLRALESFLADRAIVDFDFFCGISAGAILGALLANGIGPDEVLRSLEGRGHRVDAIGKWDLFEPNVSEIGARLLRLASELARGGQGPRGALSSLARAVPTAAFSGRRLGAWLERQLERPGMANRFGDLHRPLYVGATDQDTSQAVLFSHEKHAHVPVHRAVQASSALVPFYPPVEVDGRWYVDGAFSRTTNMRVAARRGATLVILIDPLVPALGREPGYVRERGGIYGTTQGLKALINGRFDKANRAIAANFPNVAFHLFRPEADEMRILSGSPMKYFYRREVEEIAFEATTRKLRDQFVPIARDFRLHGVTMRDPDEGEPSSSSHQRLDASVLGA